MKAEIANFCRSMNKKFGLETVYFPENDVYSMRFKGRGVHNFNSSNFFQLPKRFRQNQIRALLKIGLNHNLGEKGADRHFLNRNIGTRII